MADGDFQGLYITLEVTHFPVSIILQLLEEYISVTPSNFYHDLKLVEIPNAKCLALLSIPREVSFPSKFNYTF